MLRKGIYLSLLTALISGFSIFANKIFVSSADPLAFTTVRNILVAVFLTLAVFITGKHKSLTSIKKRDWMKLILIGALGGGVAFALFFSGLAQIGAVQANLIQKTLFLWVAVLAIPLLNERLHPIQVGGFFVIILATFVVGGPFSLTINSGAILVLGATVFWAIENVVAKQALKAVRSEVVGWARIVIGIPMLIAITLILGKGDLLFSAKTLSLIPLLTSSLFLTAYILVWYKALARLPAILATSILVIAPIITNVLTAIFITHTLPQVQITGSIILSIGMVLILTKTLVRRPLFHDQ